MPVTHLLESPRCLVSKVSCCTQPLPQPSCSTFPGSSISPTSASPTAPAKPQSWLWVEEHSLERNRQGPSATTTKLQGVSVLFPWPPHPRPFFCESGSYPIILDKSKVPCMSNVALGFWEPLKPQVGSQRQWASTISSICSSQVRGLG